MGVRELNQTIHFTIDEVTDEYLTSLGFNQNGTVSVQSIWDLDKNGGGFINKNTLNNEIEKCENWIKKYDNFMKNMENRKKFNNVKTKITGIQGDYNDLMNSTSFKDQAEIKSIGKLLQQGYALLQHLRLAIMPNAKEVKYDILLDEKTFKEIRVNMREVLSTISLQLNKKLNDIKSLEELFENTGLFLSKTRFKNKYENSHALNENYDVDIANQQGETSLTKETIYSLANSFYRDVLIKPGQERAWNSGWSYEVAKTSLYNWKQWENFYNILNDIYRESEMSEVNFIKKFSNHFKAIKIDNQKIKKTQISALNLQGVSQIKNAKIENLFKALKAAIPDTIATFSADNIPSYQHKYGDVRIGNDIGVELKNVASSGTANLIAGKTVILGIQKILNELKRLGREKVSVKKSNNKDTSREYLTENDILAEVKKVLGGDDTFSLTK